jgi:hypothetical protein
MRDVALKRLIRGGVGWEEAESSGWTLAMPAVGEFDQRLRVTSVVRLVSGGEREGL